MVVKRGVLGTVGVLGVYSMLGVVAVVMVEGEVSLSSAGEIGVIAGVVGTVPLESPYCRNVVSRSSYSSPRVAEDDRLGRVGSGVDLVRGNGFLVVIGEMTLDSRTVGRRAKSRRLGTLSSDAADRNAGLATTPPIAGALGSVEGERRGEGEVMGMSDSDAGDRRRWCGDGLLRDGFSIEGERRR